MLKEQEKPLRSVPIVTRKNILWYLREKSVHIGTSSPYVHFDFLGGVPSDMDLGEGVTADEAKRFVISNTHRYIPKFANMRAGKRLSWNWLAFIFPCGWFLSRKMYAWGSLAGALSVAFSLFAIPFSRAISQFDLTGSYIEVSELIYQNISI